MKLLATGDSHFGARADLSNKPGERLAEQETVWEWTLAQAREHHVDAVLYAGDAFEARKPDPETLLAFERPLIRHGDAGGPPILAITGNHCVSSQDTGTALDVFAEAGLLRLERSPRVVLVDGGALVCCLPWASTSRLTAATNGADREQINEVAGDLLVGAARDLFASAHAEAGRMDFVFGQQPPLILLTHFSISGTSLPSGLDVGQLREPVLPQDELLAIGFDLIIAGHIHRPQTFHGDLGFYVGSPQPLNFGEADGQTRGPWIVTLAESGVTRASTGPRHAPDSASVSFEQLQAPSRRFVNLAVDITGNEPTTGLAYLDLGLLANEHDVDAAYVKARIRATEEQWRRVDVNALRDGFERLGVHRLFIEPILERAARARDASVDDTVGEDEALGKWFASLNGTVDAGLAERALVRAQGYFELVRT